MHSLLFKSGDAIASLKEELLTIKDSKIEARAKCAELQAAHDSLLEQQKLYQELLAAADRQVRGQLMRLECWGGGGRGEKDCFCGGQRG